MSTTNYDATLSALFPDKWPAGDGDLAAVRGDTEACRGQYLVDGVIKTWRGAETDVHAAICQRAGEQLTPAIVGSMPLLTAEESLKALDAACRAYGNGGGAWPTMSVAHRVTHIETFIPLMIKVREPVVRLLMWEIGKSRVDAEKEFDRTVQYVRQTVAELKRMDREASRFALDEGYVAQIRRSPLGVVLCMGPFNYPLNETFTTLIPALIMGNTVVFKAPRFGVLLHQLLLPAFRDAFPPGVVNTVFGHGDTTATPMMASGKVDVLAFIGSSRVADLLKRQHPAPHRLRSVLGLNAKNPAIVLDDAELDSAVSECVAGSLSFNGQRCTAVKMIFVDRKIEKPFLERLSAAISALPIGMPWDKGVKITPLPDPQKPAELTQLIDDACARGAEVINRGGGVTAGSLVRPALVAGVTPDAKLWSVEQFGPVVPVHAFDDIDGVLRSIEESQVGQQLSLFGRTPARLGPLIDRLVNQVSRINLNSQCQRSPDTFPFTGRKSSAEGTLSVYDALRSFSIRGMVAAQANPANQQLISQIVSGRHSQFLSTDFLF